MYVFDFLKIDGQDCIVMEWVKGVNLAELISRQEFARRASLCAADAVFVVVSVLRALEYTHRLQVDKEEWEERLALQSLNGESVWMRLSEAYSELVTTQYRQTRGDSVSGAAGYH